MLTLSHNLVVVLSTCGVNLNAIVFMVVDI